MRTRYFYCVLSFTVILFLCAACNNITDNKTVETTVTAKDSVLPVASYTLSVPPGWTTEQIIFPIDFAPQILYKGTEELRFAKGWEDIASDEHWTYAFLWWLNDSPLINDTILQQNLTHYYSGLVQRNITARSIAAFKVVPTTVKLNNVSKSEGDTATYKGTINMLDYIAQKPMVLHCMIHLKDAGITGKTVLFFEVSPQPETHGLWKILDDLNKSIEFKK